MLTNLNLIGRTDPMNPAQFYKPAGATTVECESINALMALTMDDGEVRPALNMESKIQYPHPVNSLCLDVKTRNLRIRDFAIRLPEILLENFRLSVTSGEIFLLSVLMLSTPLYTIIVQILLLPSYPLGSKYTFC